MADGSAPPATPPAPKRDPQAPRTVLMASLAGALLLAALLGAAWMFGGSDASGPMERYAKLGPRAGAAALEGDLLRAHPLGEDVGGLFDRLQRLGFDCRAALAPGPAGACVLRQIEGRQRVTTTVTLGHDGLRLRALAVQMESLPL